MWLGITSVWDKFFNGVGRKIANGANTKAWTDLWSPLDLPLIQYVNRNMDEINIIDMVVFFVTSSGEWNFGKWKFFIYQRR